MLIGGKRPRMLKVIARHADLWDTGNDPEGIREGLAHIHAHCAEIGRDQPRSRFRPASGPTGWSTRTVSKRSSELPGRRHEPVSLRLPTARARGWNRPSAWRPIRCPVCATSLPDTWKDSNPSHGAPNQRPRTTDRAGYLRLYDTLIELHPQRQERLHRALSRIGVESDLGTLRNADLIAEDYFTIVNGTFPIHGIARRPSASNSAGVRACLAGGGRDPHDELLVRNARQHYVAEYETPAVEDSPFGVSRFRTCSSPPPGCTMLASRPRSSPTPIAT